MTGMMPLFGLAHLREGKGLLHARAHLALFNQPADFGELRAIRLQHVRNTARLRLLSFAPWRLAEGGDEHTAGLQHRPGSIPLLRSKTRSMSCACFSTCCV